MCLIFTLAALHRHLLGKWPKFERCVFSMFIYERVHTAFQHPNLKPFYGLFKSKIQFLKLNKKQHYIHIDCLYGLTSPHFSICYCYQTMETTKELTLINTCPTL